MKFYAEFSCGLPHEANTQAAFFTLNGTPAVAIVAFYNGPMESGEKIFGPLRSFGRPFLVDLGPRSYAHQRNTFDSIFPPARRSYVKSTLLHEVSDDLIERLVEHSFPLPTPWSFVAFQQMGGAVSRPPEATAFGHREAMYDVLYHAVGVNPADDTRNMQWARRIYDAVEPITRGGMYLNNIGSDQEGTDGVKTAWDTAIYARLVALKNQYDPSNLVRHNQNVRPTATGSL